MPGILQFGNLSGGGRVPGGDWVTCVTNATSTASTATELLNPLSSAKTVSQVVRVGNDVRRAIFRTKYETAISAVTTSPLIQVYAVYATDAQLNAAQSGSATATTFPTDGSVRVKRLDATVSTNASGFATNAMVPGAAGDLRDSTWKYGNPYLLNSSEFVDLCNADAILVLVATAAAVTGGTPIVIIEALFTD